MLRFVARLLVIAAALCGGVVAAAAQAYPSKPITLVCGQPPGSGPDIMSRLFAEIIGRSLGQRVLVLNRTGSGGIVAASSVAQAPPDGYTLLLVLNGTHTTVPAMQTMPFDPIKDFEFISLLYSSSGVLLVPAKSSAKTMSDFLSYARNKPGGISYGSPAIGSPAHLMGALLSESTGIPMTHVGYRGGSQIMIDLGAGMLDMTFTSSVQALPLIAQGQVRPLAVASETRLTQLPDVPTLKELGLGNVSVESWFGIAAPKGTPADIVARLNAELVKAAKDPLIVKPAEQDGVTLRTGPQEEIVKLLAADYDRLGGAVKRLQIKAE
jgi:tripartite-type tricarboxylate transporter receptor subunit TctC